MLEKLSTKSNVPIEPVPLAHKTRPSESMTFEEKMALKCNNAAVLKAMYMNCKVQRSVKNAEANALYQSYDGRH